MAHSHQGWPVRMIDVRYAPIATKIRVTTKCRDGPVANSSPYARQNGRAISSRALSSVRPMSAIMCGPTASRR